MAMIIIMEKQIPWICPLMFPLKATYYEIKKKNRKQSLSDAGYHYDSVSLSDLYSGMGNRNCDTLIPKDISTKLLLIKYCLLRRKVFF